MVFEMLIFLGWVLRNLFLNILRLLKKFRCDDLIFWVKLMLSFWYIDLWWLNDCDSDIKYIGWLLFRKNDRKWWIRNVLLVVEFVKVMILL